MKFDCIMMLNDSTSIKCLYLISGVIAFTTANTRRSRFHHPVCLDFNSIMIRDMYDQIGIFSSFIQLFTDILNQAR